MATPEPGTAPTPLAGPPLKKETRVNYPDLIWNVTRKAAADHGIFDDAVEAALTAIKSNPAAYNESLEKLVYEAVSFLVRQAHAQINRKVRQAASMSNRTGSDSPNSSDLRQEGRPVRSGCSKSVQNIFANLLDTYWLGNKRLGDVEYSDLDGIENHAESVARGHLFNARLARELRPLMRPGMVVRDLGTKKVQDIMALLKRQDDQIQKKLQEKKEKEEKEAHEAAEAAEEARRNLARSSRRRR